MSDTKDTMAGTPEARLEWLAKFAEERCGHNPTSAQGFEESIVERLNELEHRLEFIGWLTSTSKFNKPENLLNAISDYLRDVK